MKFDAVVGNPPYQLMGGSGGTNDAPIYQHFAELAAQLNPAYISLIIPSRWFSGGRDSLLSDFRNTMLTDKCIRQMVAYADSREVFPTVEIKGGLCYYLRDSQYTGDCAYSLVKEGQRQTVERNLGNFDVLIRDPILAGIVKKVMDRHPVTVDTLISGDTPFGIPTNPKSSKKNSYIILDNPSKTAITKVFYIEGSERKIGYIDKDTIVKNSSDIDNEKVFIPEAYGAGETFPHQILGVPEYGGKNAVCSQSYLYAAFEDDASAINFISYLKCKFFRALVLSVKISQHAPSKTYRFVPLQDFSKPWTDAELYEKYGLTDEEIAFIEATIKPME